VQASIRELSKSLKAGEVLLVGSGPDDAICAVARVQCESGSSGCHVFIMALAIELKVRYCRSGVADETMEYVKGDASSESGRRRLLGNTFVTCKIDTRNARSQRMAERAGFEPLGIPAARYQIWLLRLR